MSWPLFPWSSSHYTSLRQASQPHAKQIKHIFKREHVKKTCILRGSVRYGTLKKCKFLFKIKKMLRIFWNKMICKNILQGYYLKTFHFQNIFLIYWIYPLDPKFFSASKSSISGFSCFKNIYIYACKKKCIKSICPIREDTHKKVVF